jgi:hypothetical protein
MAQLGSLIELSAISYQSRKQKRMVSFWAKADEAGLWPAMICPLMTHQMG